MSAVGLDDPLQNRRCCERSHGNEEDVSTEKVDAIPLQLLIKLLGVVQLAFGTCRDGVNVLLQFIGLRRSTSVLGLDNPIHDCANGEDKEYDKGSVTQGNEHKLLASLFLEVQRVPALTFGQIHPHGLFQSRIGVFGIIEESMVVLPTAFDALFELFEMATVNAVNELHICRKRR